MFSWFAIVAKPSRHRKKMTDPEYFGIRPVDVGFIEQMMRARHGVTSLGEVLLHEKNSKNVKSMAVFG